MAQPLSVDASAEGPDTRQADTLTTARPKRLGEMLIGAGLLTPEQVDAALKEARSQNIKLGELLVKDGFVTQQDIAMVLSLQLNTPIIDLKRDRVNPDALKYVPTTPWWW